MTRINVVPTNTMHRLHLVAEYRELPRVFGLVRAVQARGLTPSTIKAPGAYTLGAGHVKFFYDKLGWLAFRHSCLVSEMLLRGMAPQFIGCLVKRNQDLLPHWWSHWEPTEEAVRVNSERINASLKNILGCE